MLSLSETSCNRLTSGCGLCSLMEKSLYITSCPKGRRIKNSELVNFTASKMWGCYTQFSSSLNVNFLDALKSQFALYCSAVLFSLGSGSGSRRFKRAPAGFLGCQFHQPEACYNLLENIFQIHISLLSISSHLQKDLNEKQPTTGKTGAIFHVHGPTCIQVFGPDTHL